jgi:hypothetical protein
MIRPDKCYVVKNEVDTSKPFQHRDGSWYIVKDKSWRRLIRINDILLDKKGNLVAVINNKKELK